MANPNIYNANTTYGNTSYLVPTSTFATTWTALTPATDTINHISAITATNVTTSTATITVSLNNAVAGGGTAYRLAYQVVVPATSAIIISDRSTGFYVDETQSIVVTSSTNNAIELTARYESLTAASSGGSSNVTAAMLAVSTNGIPGSLLASGPQGMSGVSSTGSVGTVGVLRPPVALTGTSSTTSVGSVTSSYTTPPTQQALFGFGTLASTAKTAITNKVSNTGVVSNDTTGVGTARADVAASGYGGDKAIFAFGYTGSAYAYVSNLVSNTGVVATDTSTTGSLNSGAAAVYGYIYGIIISGNQSCYITDTGAIGANNSLTINKTNGAMASYGNDKAIYGFGIDNIASAYSTTVNLISNTGVIASNSGSLDQPRIYLAASGYGGDKAIFGYGNVPGSTNVRYTNLVSNTGVVSSYSLGVGTARQSLAAAGYGGDKGIFGYGGGSGGFTAVTNLVSNTGVVSSDTTGVGTARVGLSAAGFSYT